MQFWLCQGLSSHAGVNQSQPLHPKYMAAMPDMLGTPAWRMCPVYIGECLVNACLAMHDASSQHNHSPVGMPKPPLLVSKAVPKAQLATCDHMLADARMHCTHAFACARMRTVYAACHVWQCVAPVHARIKLACLSTTHARIHTIVVAVWVCQALCKC